MQREADKNSSQSLSPRGPLSQSLAGTDKSLTQSEFNKGEGTCRKPRDGLQSPEPPQTSLPCPKLPEHHTLRFPGNPQQEDGPQSTPVGAQLGMGVPRAGCGFSLGPQSRPSLPLRPALPIRLKLVGENLLAVCGLQSHAGQSAGHGNWNILGK